MFRSISNAISTAFSSSNVNKIIMMIRLDFDSGTLAWNSGTNNITYNSVTYIASSTLGSVSNINESTGIKSSGITVTLSGVQQELIAELLLEPFLNRKGYVFLAMLDSNDAFNSNNVVQVFEGKIDSISGVQSKNPSFSVSIRSRLSDWERTRNIKYTDADQQKIHVGDKGMEFIPQLSQKKIIWPLAAFLPDLRD